MIVFATNNQHKLTEVRQIVGDAIEIRSLADIGCHDDIPETGATLEENAAQKARYISERYGVDCFADDTGLEVDALGGAPGVYSARYAGPGHDSAANMAKLLGEMAGSKERTARFRTVIALSRNGELSFVEGRVDGTIAIEPHGSEGFGYDPVFLPKEGGGRSFAEMSAEEKNAISHRGRAMKEFLNLIDTQ
ncbi:MAG: RdgB/HAM1 family non-canonical purine NTP pyrophosphatase [Bacteroides sp.]|nr:RdgB/HAM1 family non-canonical purine NTP pyrophosphatase [Bacteroides sp.]MCM1379641.1 RdgB/HAM1 family non-canonical purine NTP pyrophosphatase [Bacteroides sp.]MCM1445977.1 RdgB/HAM1 family non-canonical purine NTP pyrophosphatase [Prevotella sp.]